MSDFEFPTNVKQIGSISGTIKIYMEDYVYSYLQQYSAAGGYCERLAALIGRRMVIDGQKVLFISGAVQAKNTKREDDIEVFTDESWKCIHEQIDTYFSGFEILGWMQSQPGYGVHLNNKYERYHFSVFKEAHQVMFVNDPLERNSAFFVPDPKKKELMESKGYFIYYEKNRNMHEYMLNNKIRKINVPEDVENAVEEIDSAEKEAIESDRTVMEKIALRFPSRGGDETRAKATDNKRLINMLVSLSALLLVICFIMGIGLIQNEDRITKLEASLSEVSATYANAIEQIRNGKSEDVFAAQQTETDDKAGAAEEILTEIVEEPDEFLATQTMPIDITLREEAAKEETPPTETPSPTPTPTPTSTPTPTPPPTPAPSKEPEESLKIPDTYTIQEGDSLIFISRYFYGTSDMVSAIMELNGIEDPNQITFGTQLKLPQN